jgi:hypothetical protein
MNLVRSETLRVDCTPFHMRSVIRMTPLFILLLRMERVSFSANLLTVIRQINLLQLT